MLKNYCFASPVARRVPGTLVTLDRSGLSLLILFGHWPRSDTVFSAGVGAKLIAVEKQIQSFVLMANAYSLHDYVYDDRNQELRQRRPGIHRAKTSPSSKNPSALSFTDPDTN